MAQTLSPDTLTTFHARAQRYVHAKGWSGAEAEDLVSTMVLDVLEHPETPHRLAYAYMHALDTLHPRTQIAGQRCRHRPCSLEEAPQLATRPAPPPPATALGDLLPPSGQVRAIMLLAGVYGYTFTEIATLFGVSVSRIHQILRAARPTPAPPVRHGISLTLEVTWLTL